MPENLWQTLGVAAPLVAVLMFLLKQATDERREITTQFLAALKTTVEQSNEARLRAANEMALLREHSTQEHEAMLEILREIHRDHDAVMRRTE